MKIQLEPPAHLRTETADWWRVIVKEYPCESHHLRLLRLACEAWDRGQEAREAILRDGAYHEVRPGLFKGHPALAVEKESRLAFARLLKELCIGYEPPKPHPGRPPGGART